MDLSPHVDLLVERLDLSGIAPARRFQVVATFERELTELLSVRGLPPQADQDRLGSGTDREIHLDIALDANPVLVGRALAHSVYEVLG